VLCLVCHTLTLSHSTHLNLRGMRVPVLIGAEIAHGLGMGSVTMLTL